MNEDTDMIRAPNIENVLPPPEFELGFYRETYPDLEALSDDELHEHFLIHGKREGRFGTSYVTRAKFVELFAESGSLLEIGPFHVPVARGPNVKYFDVLDADALAVLGKSMDHDISGIPTIDYVSPNGDMSIVNEVFDAAVSSHCIEHQPSLVRHLRQISDVLKPGGRYYVIAPDKRYCFDHFRPLSTIADVLVANDDRQVHSLRDLIEHRAMLTHNDPSRHWVGDHGEPGPKSARLDLVGGALNEHSPTGYIPDVHAWKFVPETFREILQDLVTMGLSDLEPERVYNTPLRCHEFCAVLRKRS